MNCVYLSPLLFEVIPTYMSCNSFEHAAGATVQERNCLTYSLMSPYLHLHLHIKEPNLIFYTFKPKHQLLPHHATAQQKHQKQMRSQREDNQAKKIHQISTLAFHRSFKKFVRFICNSVGSFCSFGRWLTRQY